ncbi:ABC transporter ATP-binding protein [Chromobacterium sinusclupearum]|uniref:ABC transporter ATP-binding protein n=1 Tax=Chromobacterium sinusclupearum TaxID=2077146 RepID=A0A2K4MRM6_9NEIS|nr:ABC transporter ATP-binding protein [Chromobacterium sinusclupearum]POA99750.1 ABC transporter ATP-binding protein [Chromobacterium sinusclupearum]
MSSDYFIEFRNVSFAYGDRPILKNLTLGVPRGKLVAVMGGSGSGKTTLLRLISGQIRPQSGQVLIDGVDIARMSKADLYQHRRRMGMLFQFGALFTDLNVAENVAFPLREHTKLPESMIRDLVTLKLEAVGLRGTQKLMPAELSGGMARRVALARAIALDPQLMLYDEPFTGLDPISLGVIALLIKKLNDALGTTAVMVTHDVHKSLEIVDHVLFVAGGQVIAQGSPDEVRNSDSPWVRQFVNGEADGPVHYSYPAATSLAADLGLQGGAHA